jgi:hypothetical protein
MHHHAQLIFFLLLPLIGSVDEKIMAQGNKTGFGFDRLRNLAWLISIVTKL